MYLMEQKCRHVPVGVSIEDKITDILWQKLYEKSKINLSITIDDNETIWL